MFELRKSDRSGKKWMVTDTERNKTVHFGGEGYSDYTIHKDPDRKQSYISRHKKNEKWGKRGVHTAGFWSRWLLWNLPSLTKSIKDTEERFNIKIVKKRN
jgi:hypothetical protein